MSQITVRGALDVGPYKGYYGRAEYDSDVGEFHGRVAATRDVITFVGTTPEELITAFQESVEDYLEFCKESGDEPEKPYSGNFLVRTTPKVHRDLAVAADREGKSLNQFVNDALDRVVAGSAQTLPHYASTTQLLIRNAPLPQGGFIKFTPVQWTEAEEIDVVMQSPPEAFAMKDFGGRMGKMTVAVKSKRESV